MLKLNCNIVYSINKMASAGGLQCQANDGAIEQADCNTNACPVNCVGKWGAFSTCMLDPNFIFEIEK